jgi:hypothetical protein
MNREGCVNSGNYGLLHTFGDASFLNISEMSS